jgi:hypothetical protein
VEDLPDFNDVPRGTRRAADARAAMDAANLQILVMLGVAARPTLRTR